MLAFFLFMNKVVIFDVPKMASEPIFNDQGVTTT